MLKVCPADSSPLTSPIEHEDLALPLDPLPLTLMFMLMSMLVLMLMSPSPTRSQPPFHLRRVVLLLRPRVRGDHVGVSRMASERASGDVRWFKGGCEVVSVRGVA
jgi:hypothetical protein